MIFHKNPAVSVVATILLASFAAGCAAGSTTTAPTGVTNGAVVATSGSGNRHTSGDEHTAATFGAVIDEDAGAGSAIPTGGEVIAVTRSLSPDPIIRRGTNGGGPVQASSRFPECTGSIATDPMFVLKVDEPIAYLRVMVESSADPTLVIALADGRVLCNDDAEGLDSMVEGSFPVGLHRVWVGAYSEDQAGRLPYTLGITTQQSMMPNMIERLPATR